MPKGRWTRKETAPLGLAEPKGAVGCGVSGRDGVDKKAPALPLESWRTTREDELTIKDMNNISRTCASEGRVPAPRYFRAPQEHS